MSPETIDLLLFIAMIYAGLYMIFLPLLIKKGKGSKDKNTESD